MDITVGKTYRHKSTAGWTATIRYVGKDYIVYTLLGPGHDKEAAIQVDLFGDFFEEIPAWKPEVGKTALYTGGASMRNTIRVVAIDGDHAWIKFPNSTTGVIVEADHLSDPRD